MKEKESQVVIISRKGRRNKIQKRPMKKKYLLYAIAPFLTSVIIGAGVYAASNTVGMNNPMSNLVTAIAQKFNLNPSDVQQVFNKQKAQMEAQCQQQRIQMEVKMQQQFTDRINQAVTDGKLNQEQADKILVKKAELEAQKANLQNQGKDESRTVLKEQMDSLKQWAADNNIPQEYIPFTGFGMKGIRGGAGMRFGKWTSGKPCGKTTDSTVQ